MIMSNPDGSDDPKALVDYCLQEFFPQEQRPLHVYEEIVHLARWVRGFAPRNVLEIGTTGPTFFILSRLATGKKASMDIRDVRPRIHHFMFGHDWRFFLGNSHTKDMRDAVASYCSEFDLIFIDGDHSYEGVRSDFYSYRDLLSPRGAILFHDVDPEHLFKETHGGGVWRFWRDLDEGCKTTLVCNRSSGRIQVFGHSSHFGGIGIWSPN